ncbi:Ldh family oxidoreductase [Tropicimonas sp. TH_r6]|uniref:Ldh family oxidoreductase n=1 Tax=Tropicimonas sp. TH_r6 TaxID=3082085 RepID=UPI002952A8A9|nr:Ldh family oxidoreductase [Tropicimonas sp. TH_r6]MDV7144343.1 Ldh family oxidoreductase [Tropicimonas sp. TH_r6]
MTQAATLSFDDLWARIQRVFETAGVRRETAAAVARGIASGERDACKSHGVYRIEGCLRALAAGKVVPNAVPKVHVSSPSVVEVDAGGGYANAAYEAAMETLVARTRESGLAALVIRDCLHFSALWYEVEQLAGYGLASLSMCPSYATVAPSGGDRPLLGTNPFAFGWPRVGELPYVFDFATSVAARGEIELHRRAGTPIPEGWAVDCHGQPTTDPQAALDGAMLPFGGHKGSAISTMIELLSGAMLGEFMSQEALDFNGTTSILPRHGALILALEPGVFAKRSGRDPIAEGERLITAIEGQGARLPSQRRFAARARALSEGIRLSAEEVEQLERFEALGLGAVAD